MNALPSSRPRRRFRDIADNIDRIIAYTADFSESDFSADDRTRDAVERCLQRISEAATKLGSLAESLLPQHDWLAIRGLGNILRHDYDRVETALLWHIVSIDLPPLRRDLQRLIQQWPTE
jgi:uncharacterized protein with HEPN domain